MSGDAERKRYFKEVLSKGKHIISGNSTANRRRINWDKQKRHEDWCEDSKGRSILTMDAQLLLDQYFECGNPQYYDKGGLLHKECFIHHKDIGIWIDPSTNKREPTNRGIIHYSNRGSHIVPVRRLPKEGEK